MVQTSFKIEAGKVKAGVKVIATDMPRILKRDALRVVKWIIERTSMYFPSGARGGYTAPWTKSQAMGAKWAYVRTGAYGRGWQYKPLGGNSFQIFNRTSYARYVGGDAYGNGQAGIHRGRWYVFAQVAKTGWDTVLRQYLKVDLRELIRKSGLGDGEAFGL